MRPFIPLLIAFVILLISGGAYAFGYYTLNAAVDREHTLATQVATKTAQLAAVEQAQTTLSSLANDEATLNQYSIDRSGIVSFLETLQASGKPFGTQMQVVSVSDERDGTHPRVLLALMLTGPFDGVMRTLGTIEYSPNDGVLKTLNLETAPGTKGVPVWTASVGYSVGVASSTTAKP